MESSGWLFLAVMVVGLSTLIGFFKTKTAGFGKFNASILIVIFALTLSSLLYAGGKLEGAVMGHLLFAAVGFAGGLVSGRDPN